MYRHTLFALILTTLCAAPAPGQSRHDRKLQQLEESAQIRSIAGGVTFPTPVPIGKAFEAILTNLKRNGHDIDVADPEAGRIATLRVIAGNYSQTGIRILATFIKDAESLTSIRVSVTVQKRKKLLMTEPWSDPKIDEPGSAKVAAAFEQLLKTL